MLPSNFLQNFLSHNPEKTPKKLEQEPQESSVDRTLPSDFFKNLFTPVKALPERKTPTDHHLSNLTPNKKEQTCNLVQSSNPLPPSKVKNLNSHGSDSTLVANTPVPPASCLVASAGWTSDVDHHRQVTEQLVAFINERESAKVSDVLAVLLVGDTGSGKSWVVEQAASLTNHQIVVFDSISRNNDSVFSALFRSNDHHRRLVLLDGADDFGEGEAMSVLRFIVAKIAGVLDNKKRRTPSASWWLNPVVITVQDKYHKNVFGELGQKLKHALREIRCGPLSKKQIANLVTLECQALKLPLTTEVHRLYSSSDDLNYILNQLRWMATPCQTKSLLFETPDHKETNVFNAALKLMNREKGEPSMASRGCDLNDYLTLWESSPACISTVMYKSYPDFVTTVWPANCGKPGPMRPGDCRIQGLDEMVLLTEALSDEDVSPQFGDAFMQQTRVAAFWATLHNKVERNGNPRIQDPRQPRQACNTDALRRCRIDHREFEKLEWVHLMNQIQVEAKVYKDCNAVVSDEYNLARHVGYYISGDVKVDMFGDEASEKTRTKTRKRKYTKPDDLGPRSIAVQILASKWFLA